MRRFETGATRDDNEGKFDYGGYLSPVVLERFAQYMYRHQFQPDGQRREGGNWKKGMPISSYKESLIRHVMDWWRAYERDQWDVCDELGCAILFNIQGFLHERLRGDPHDSGVVAPRPARRDRHRPRHQSARRHRRTEG